MTKRSGPLLLLSLLVLLASAAPAQIRSLRLRSGETVLGTVTDVGSEAVQMQVSYPEAGRRSIARKDIAPASLWNLLAARAPADDADAHVELARTARELGLTGQAIAALRQAARLDPARREDLEQDIAAIRTGTAQELLQQARAAKEAGRTAAARLMLQAIVERYADTDAAAEAKTLREQLSRTASARPAAAAPDRGSPADATASGAEPAAPAPGTETMDADRLRDLLERADERLQRTARVADPSAPSTVEDQRALERRIDLLEPLWRRIAKVAAPADEAALAQQLQRVRSRTRSTLLDAYVGIGSILAQREAYPEAQDYAERACDLDPDSRGCHDLYRLIQIGRTVGRD